MKCYTGYFAKLAAYERANLLPVSIARFPPKFYTGDSAEDFMPSAELLSKFKAGQIDKAQYKDLYIAELDKNARENHLMGYWQVKGENYRGWLLRGNDALIFLCYECPSDFCHRQIFAEYARENWNWDVSEYEFKKEPTLF